VCAAGSSVAYCSGVGDVIVLMPHLTVTAYQIDRIVSVLAEAIDEVCG